MRWRHAIEFLVSHGADKTAHGDKKLLDHLTGVSSTLLSWKCPEELALAGLMHAVYGTKRFRKGIASKPDREVIRVVIGERAERIVHLFSKVDNKQFESAVQNTSISSYLRCLEDLRLIGESAVEDVCHLYLANWLDQGFKNTPARARRKAEFFEELCQYLNPAAQTAIAEFSARQCRA